MDQMKAMRSFVAVVDEGGFGKAGQRLGLSKALVSKQISALEAHLSCRLLYRTTRRSSLSAAGEAYLAHCGGESSTHLLRSLLARVGCDGE